MNAPRRIVVTGATGLVGTALVRSLLTHGDSITLLARNIDKARTLFPAAERVLLWAPGVAGEWQHAIDGSDAVINLAGEPIAGARWTRDYKQRIYDSRVRGTRELVDAIRRAATPPAVLVSASAVGYYGDTGDTEPAEDAPQGHGWLALVCSAWEKQAQQAAEVGVRVVLPRIGIVLATDGGALPRLVQPFRFFIGGPLGNGRQYLPWIHIDDLVGIMLLALDTPSVSGPLNAVAPEQITNRDVAHAIGRALGRPSWLPVPGFALTLALGEFGTSLLEGQRLAPRTLLDAGFRFRHTAFADTLPALLPH